MLQRVQHDPSQKPGGVVTYPNLFAVQAGQSPNSLNVKYSIGEIIEKRLGTTTINSVALEGTGGWGSFDYGAANLRYHIVSAGTGIYASSNRGLTYVAIATNQTQGYQWFERAKPYLIVTSDSYDPTLYWGGSIGTFAAQLAPGSAPAARFCVDFQGFTFLMNTSTRKRGLYYADNNTLLTDPWSNSFDLPSAFDDEITGAIILYKKMYVFTRYKSFRISYVGGNPDFGYQDVKDWGAVPGTLSKVNIPQFGEVIICLSWDKTLKLFDGSEDDIISDRFFQNNNVCPVAFSLINTTAIEKSRAETDSNEQVYKLLVAITPSTQTTHTICYNYRSDAFYPYDNTPFHTLTMTESGNSKLLLAVDRSGRVHMLDSGNRDITVSVNDYYESHLYYSQTPDRVSKGHTMNFYFFPTSSGTLTYQDRTNFSNVFGDPKDFISFQNTAGVVQVVKIINLPATYNTFQYRITSSANNADPWKMTKADLAYNAYGVGKG